MTKTTPKGRTPSLIGGTNGRPKRVEVKKKSECSRCHVTFVAGQTCIEIPQTGAYSSARRVCDECFQNILQKTTEDLEAVKMI
jgi:hypothetical protein